MPATFLLPNNLVVEKEETAQKTRNTLKLNIESILFLLARLATEKKWIPR